MACSLLYYSCWEQAVPRRLQSLFNGQVNFKSNGLSANIVILTLCDFSDTHTSEKFRKIEKKIKNFRMHPNASGHVRKPPKTSENVQNRRKHIDFSRKLPKFFRNFRTHPNASERIRMDPNGSVRIRTSSKTQKNCRKRAKNRANVEI